MSVGRLRLEARGQCKDGFVRGDPRRLLHAGLQLRLQLLRDVPHGEGEGLQLLPGLCGQGGVGQRALDHGEAVLEVVELQREALRVAHLEEPGLGGAALPQAALQGPGQVPAAGLELRPEAPVEGLGGSLRGHELEELLERAGEGTARAMVVQAVLVADDGHGQHPQNALLDASLLPELYKSPQALDAALDVAELHADAQETLPHPPALAAAARGFHHAVARLLKLPQCGVRGRQVGPGFGVLVVHADASRECGGRVLEALKAHLRTAHGEPDVSVQWVDVQREGEGVDGLGQLVLDEAVAAERALRAGEAAFGQLPGLLVVPRLLLQIAQAAPEPGGRALLQQLADQVERLDISLRDHETVDGLRPHAQLLELLVGSAHHPHPHHARAHLPLEVEARGVARAVHEQQAVGRGGPRVPELVHERLQLEGRALARLVPVVLRAAAVVEAAAEAEPVGRQQRAVLAVVLGRLLLGSEDALGDGVHLLEEQLVVGVARDPQVVALGEQEELLHGAEGLLQHVALVVVDGRRKLGHLEHVCHVVDARELQVLGDVADGRVALCLSVLHLSTTAGPRRSAGICRCFRHRFHNELRELLCLILALDTQDPCNLKGESNMAARRLLHNLP
mmetsp:Transcript_121040/g.353720  ORF Transcript_121040/g.353720 Transcript_121040/m.353720 type:complete len:623 (+) Transcript_121040:150-2018(+)